MTTGIGTLEREAPGLLATESEPGAASPQRRRWILGCLGVGLLVLLLVLVALTTNQSSGGDLDPRSAAPSGTRALAVLLRDRGVTVDRGSRSGAGRTVVVPFPEALTRSDLDRLLSSGADVVLVDPGPLAATQLDPDGSLTIRTRSPGCDLDPAQVAGPARLGGTSYASGNAATSCYDGSLVELAAGTIQGGGRITVLGAPDFLTNQRLGQEGNAALAIGLLARQPALTWYTARRATGGTSLTDLLPKAIPWALLQIAVALAVIGFWRGRRLGPVVTEPLPVVVRAAETVLGRARLYASARARDTAAEAIRTGSRARLAALLHLDAMGLGAPGDGGPNVLVEAVASRTGVDPAAAAALLYQSGGYRAGESDAALVRLAAELDQLEKLVREGTRR